MFWSLSLQLMPEETILEDSTKVAIVGLKPTYSVFLSNKRVIFRFDGLGSSMTQSFLYSEITGAASSKRMFINYLALRTARKEYFLHTPDPTFWAAKILEFKKNGGFDASQSASERPARRKKQELTDMLNLLRKHAVLTDAEFEEKKKLVETLEL